MSKDLKMVLEEPLALPQRALPARPGDAVTVDQLCSAGLNVARGDVVLPAMVLKESALAHNLRTMADYSRSRGFLLAPHGKTTMAPQLFRRQLEAGAWGITVANVVQAAVARWADAARILIANEVVGSSDLAQLAQWLGDHSHETYCLVDSEDAVGLLAAAMRQAPGERDLPVLIEVGIPGGRTGCRDPETAYRVASAVHRAPRLCLAGVEGYEGGLGIDRSPATLASVDYYLDRLRVVALGLLRSSWLDQSRRPIVSAGGSKYFDRVADVLVDGDWQGADVDVVVRSGCYITHDHGRYADVSPLSKEGGEYQLHPALEVWSEVLSVPEPNKAIVGMGKRDVPYDLGMPVALHLGTAKADVVAAPTGIVVSRLDDQHGYLSTPVGALRVGDRLGFGVSHPCTAFDKWRLIPVVDDDYTLVDLVRTYF